MSRGIIAAAAIINIHGNGFTMERGLNPQEINYYALYWDRVVIPGGNLVYIGLPNEDELIECGAIERPMVQFRGSYQGSEVADTFAKAQSIIANKLIKEDRETDWVVHQIGDNLNLPAEFMETRNVLKIDLINSLPVPSSIVPIGEILDFKNRRADELNALHSAIDEVYIEALKCPDQSLGSTSEIRNLKKIIKNLDAVSSEQWSLKSPFDFSIEFNLNGRDLMLSAAGGAFIGGADPLSITMGTMIGGVASLFNIKGMRSECLKSATNQTKLAYLSRARREGIVDG